jgi:alanine-alpha-ketoisovalerate/valine-pyruvate aminotransferase
MSEFYTKAQSDAQAAVIGARMKARTTAAAIKAGLLANADTNVLTDAEKAKLASLEASKYRGTFASFAVLPLTGNSDGSYANYDAGAGTAVKLAIWDVNDTMWRDVQGASTAETAASVKTKYEANPDTNAFTDAHKAKLDAISEAPNITAFTAALDAALA